MADMSANFSHLCLNQQQQMMYGTSLEYNLQRYFYPAMAIFGILGNVLNLTVLLNRSMRSRANSFLAVLAFADIIFLSLLFPNILANYSIFTYNYYFRWFYFHTKVHLISMANWCSSVAIWCVIAVCADRLVGIRNPLYARAAWSNGYQKLISVCKVTFILLMIILPIIMLTFLNLTLLCALRKRQKHLSISKDMTDRRHNDHIQKTENRVTLTVAFIVTMFTVTNGPSALVHLVRQAYQLGPAEFYDMTMVCSTLVICGKASNFILFCLGSKHFRVRLLRLTQRKVHRKIDSLAGSFMPASKMSTASRNCPSSHKTSTSFANHRPPSTIIETVYEPLVESSRRFS